MTYESTTWNPSNGRSAVTALITVNGKAWERTPNYSTIPKEDLPVNGFNHTIASWEQALWTGWSQTNKADNSVTVVYGPLYANDGWEIDGWHANAYAQAQADDKLQSLKNAAIIKALNKAADTKGNLAVSAKEASKTSALILGTAKRVLDAARAFRKGNLKEVARQLHLTPKTAHKRWLEYKYGWMPLLMEVKGAAEFLGQQSVGRPPRFSVRSSEKAQVTWDDTYEDTLVYGAPWNREDSFTADLEVRVKLWLEVESPAISQMQQLGLTNPALYAWEVIPFSFVFDWFIQVGDYLTALTALNGLSLRKSMLEIIDVTTYHGFIAPIVNYDAGSLWLNVGGRSFHEKRRNYVRTPTVDTNPLSLYPPAKAAPSFGKLVTGLALLRAQSRGIDRGLRL